jgi:hypothetical protein
MLLKTDVTYVIDSLFSGARNGPHDKDGDRRIKRRLFLKAAASEPARPQGALVPIGAGYGECPAGLAVHFFSV